MSGKGQCNITHGGPVRDFVVHYGDKGKSIRKLLQRHSNVKLCRFMESIGVPLTEREDGENFPFISGQPRRTIVLDEIHNKRWGGNKKEYLDNRDKI